MKRLLVLVLVLCLAVGLCACGGSKAPQSQESAGTQGNSDELYEKSGTMEDGTVFTTYRRGGPEGTPAKLVYDTPDGTHCEETYGLEGNLEHSITVYADGNTYLEFYSSGNIRYQKHTFNEKTFEFTYDEAGYEIYYHETGGGQEVEMFADETGMLVTILVNGVEKTGNDFLWFSTGHNFRSVKQ